jgi:hypothetical protein
MTGLEFLHIILLSRLKQLGQAEFEGNSIH